MGTSSPDTCLIRERELKEAFAGLLGRPILSFDAVNSGGNSRVYRIYDVEDSVFAGKVYFSHPDDTRDRLATEYLALSFLHEHGIEAVPKPVAADRRKGLALYEYVEGDKIPSHEIGPMEIREAVSFLIELKHLRASSEAMRIPFASEACFSIGSLFSNLDYRLTRLKAPIPMSRPWRAMNQFLEENLAPALAGIKSWARSRVNSQGLNCEAELSSEQRTLSPSDFGFHNALRTRAGRLVWLDFEYFGWDDPAKMTADFLLHPAMSLDREPAKEFVEWILRGFPEIKDFRWRLETLYPLYGLKWCFILLNEFVPSGMERRDFALGSDTARGDIQWRQLQKAKVMLEKVLSEYEDFPYC